MDGYRRRGVSCRLFGARARRADGGIPLCTAAADRSAEAALGLYPALLIGIACYALHLWFFTGIFGVVAFSLWTILAIWIGFFVLTAWSLKPRVLRPAAFLDLGRGGAIPLDGI